MQENCLDQILYGSEKAPVPFFAHNYRRGLEPLAQPTVSGRILANEKSPASRGILATHSSLA